MNLFRVRSVVVGAFACVALIVLLTQILPPPAVQAYWEPQIAKHGPKDPGTPYEEPEGDPGNNEDPPKPPDGITGEGELDGTVAGEPATLGEKLLAEPLFWRLQLLVLVKI